MGANHALPVLQEGDIKQVTGINGNTQMNYEEHYWELVKDFRGNTIPKDENGNRPDPSFNLMMEDLRNDVPFALSRYGDGELLAVLSDGYLTGRPKGENNTNADGAKYYDSLRESLREILISRPTYKIGLQHFAWRQLPGPIERFIVDYQLADLNWVTSDCLHRANMKRPHQMEEFFEILNTKDVVLVGPKFLEKVKKFKLITRVAWQIS